MKKLLFTISIIVAAISTQAQTKFGFAAEKYDNFNSNDPDAGFELVVFTENNDTLRVPTGASVSDVPGTARPGLEYNFTVQNYLFPIGTTIYNGTNRKK